MAVALWVGVSWTFSAYVHVIGHYAIFYGGLATVAVTLLWFYLSSLSFAIGVEVNAQLKACANRVRHRLCSRQPRPPARFRHSSSWRSWNSLRRSSNSASESVSS